MEAQERNLPQRPQPLPHLKDPNHQGSCLYDLLNWNYIPVSKELNAL